MKQLFITILLLASFLFSGCGAYLNKNVNPYHFGMTQIDPQIYKKSKDVKSYLYEESSVKYFLKRGYVLKAKSAFRNRFVHPDWAKLAAKQMGASIMLLDKNYVGSVSGRRTLVFRVPGDTYKVTSNTKGNINYDSNTDTYVYGSNWDAYGTSTTYGNINHNSTTTTTIQTPDRYKSTTVPYQHHYYDHFAVFMVKKYYWLNSDRDFYKDKKLKERIGVVKAREWFSISDYLSGKNRAILYNGKLGYISNKVDIQ